MTIDFPLRHTLTGLVERFAELWERRATPPSLEEFVSEQNALTPRELTDLVLLDQAYRWQQGLGPAAENYLQTWPTVANDPQLRLDIVYGEYRARRRRDEPVSFAEFAERFPELADSLRRQVDLHSNLVRQESVDDAAPCSEMSTTHQYQTSRPHSDPEAPLAWSDYELQVELGRGGMGTVYRARQKSLDRLVAIKWLKEGLLQTPEIVERFLREARAVAKLRHPNIVEVHGIGRTPHGSYFLVMDFVEGVSAQERLGQGPVPVEEAVSVTRQVAEAVAHANGSGVIHRDLKPGNVLIDHEGRVLVTDFGLAKQLGTNETSLSIPGQIIGTPQYIAPEQVDPGLGPSGMQVDVYGLGALLYALLVGRPPLDGDNTMCALRNVLTGAEPPPPRIVRPEVPVAVEEICMRCLKREPKARCPDAEAVRNELDRAVSRPQEWNRRPPVQAASARRRSWSAWLVVVVMSGGLFLLLWHMDGKPPQDEAKSSPASLRAERTPVDIRWKAQVFQVIDDQVRSRPLREGVMTGERLRLEFRFSELVIPYVIWIGSGGRAELVFPRHPGSASATRRVNLPPTPGQGFPIEDPPGTEVCLLILRKEPFSDPERWLALTRPHQPFPALPPGQILRDGIPVRSTVHAVSKSELADADSSHVFQYLNPQTGSRDLGKPEPLSDSKAAAGITRWFRKLPQDLGSMHYLAIPHIGRANGEDVGEPNKTGNN